MLAISVQVQKHSRGSILVDSAYFVIHERSSFGRVWIRAEGSGGDVPGLNIDRKKIRNKLHNKG